MRSTFQLKQKEDPLLPKEGSEEALAAQAQAPKEKYDVTRAHNAVQAAYEQGRTPLNSSAFGGWTGTGGGGGGFSFKAPTSIPKINQEQLSSSMDGWGGRGVTAFGRATPSSSLQNAADINAARAREALRAQNAPLPQAAPGAQGAAQAASPQGELDKFYEDMMKDYDKSWAGTQEMGQSNLAALQRRAAAMQGSMGRSVAGGFAGAMSGAYLGGMQQLYQARQAHEAGARDLKRQYLESKVASQRHAEEMGLRREEAAAGALGSIEDPERRAEAQIMDAINPNSPNYNATLAAWYQQNQASYLDPSSPGYRAHGTPWADILRNAQVQGWV